MRGSSFSSFGHSARTLVRSKAIIEPRRSAWLVTTALLGCQYRKSHQARTDKVRPVEMKLAACFLQKPRLSDAVVLGQKARADAVQHRWGAPGTLPHA